jgi:hypothetical protein
MQPQTRAEATGYRETSLHHHVMEFLSAVDKRHLTLSSFGTSPGGRDMPLVVMSTHGVKTPEDARRVGLPVVLIINGIHAGEVEGKEASMMLMRDLQRDHRDLLAQMTLVIVPLFNPDGNDAVDPANRKLNLPKLEGQIGPELVGTRVNSKGINLNRDYMKQASEEMRALQSKVAQVWQPDLTIDTHATNGSVHRMQMTYDVPHTIASGRAEPIVYMREQMMPAVQAALARNHSVLAGWYGNFVEDERSLDARTDADPTASVREGWMTYTHHPRFGSNYRGLTNRLDLLLECYSYLEFPERVRTTYATLLEALRYVGLHRDDVMQVVAASAAPRDQIAVRYRLDAFDAPITIPTRTPRTPDGTPSEVSIRHVANFIGTKLIARPRAYLVPPALAAHLERHGLLTTPATGEYAAEIATVTGYGSEGGRKILESESVGDVHVQWARATRTAPVGSRLVATDHPRAAIAVYLCEPESDDSAIENGILAAPAVGEETPVWRITE